MNRMQLEASADAVLAQYPTEAREAVAMARHKYREARPVLLDEARTARLLRGRCGRRVSTVYGKDLKRIQADMVLERAILAKTQRDCTNG
jgi:hypothetical protein